MAEQPTAKCELYTAKDNELHEQLGHTEETPTCFLVAYWLPSRDDATKSQSRRRAITRCLPSSYFSRSEMHAKRLQEIVQGVVDKTSMEKESSLLNILMNIAQLVFATVNVYYYRKRPSNAPIQAAPILVVPIQAANAVQPSMPRARRSRNPSDD